MEKEERWEESTRSLPKPYQERVSVCAKQNLGVWFHLYSIQKEVHLFSYYHGSFHQGDCRMACVQQTHQVLGHGSIPRCTCESENAEAFLYSFWSRKWIHSSRIHRSGPKLWSDGIHEYQSISLGEWLPRIILQQLQDRFGTRVWPIWRYWTTGGSHSPYHPWLQPPSHTHHTQNAANTVPFMFWES